MGNPLPQFLAKPLIPPDGGSQHLMFGNLDLWLQRDPTEWRAAIVYQADREDRPTQMTDTAPPDDAVWTRWVTGKTEHGLGLRPKMPDRPVVVRPESPVSLLPGQGTDFYIGVPLWIEVHAVDGDGTLMEIPSVKLSNTWFGEPVQGELCYAMRTLAHVDAAKLVVRLHRAICPVQIRNAASETLTFERICLRCTHLSLFFLGNRFWGNTTRMTHRGQNEWNRVAYAPTPPSGRGEATPVTGPRDAVRRGFIGRSLQLALGPQL